MTSRATQNWFDWDSRAAVVAGERAFVLTRGGWRAVSPDDVTWDGRPLPEADARRAFADDLRAHGDPPPAIGR
ncbi:MAG: hypothetical protein K2Y71_04565 [Xanthobacteraceae bacterium]|nr:hypothetical protein [Xanthobacteraceae bacterium]